MITKEEFELLKLLSEYDKALAISKMSIEDRIQIGRYACPELADFLASPITNGE